MTPKERAAMQAAWVWMDWYASNNGTLEPVDLNETIAALREALAEPKKPEECAKGCPPLQVCDYCQKAEQADEIDWIETNKALAKEIIELKKQAEQEPVMWITPDGEGWRMRFDQPVNDVPLGWTPLYAAPVRTKDLTDDEISEIEFNTEPFALEFARAVIAADREKNK